MKKLLMGIGIWDVIQYGYVELVDWSTFGVAK